MKEKRSEKADADESSGVLEDSLEAEKEQLKEQISQLRSLISEIEENSEILKFGDVDKTATSFSAITSGRRRSKNPPNLNVLMRREFHKFIGFYCAKVDDTEYIFNYRPHDKIQPDKIYSVQICNKNGEATVEKWVLPVAIDINDVLDETPINNISAIIPFLKNWKLHIDCYTERKLQFHELKDSISDSSNCTIEANPGFTLLTLRMFGLYNKSRDHYFDLDVFLLYKKNETLACKINTEWSRKKCSESEKSLLTAYAKCLKSCRLAEAFRSMTDAEDQPFFWEPENHDDSPLELNDTSDSDEETILGKITRDRKKRKRKRRLSKGKNKKKKSSPEESGAVSPPSLVSKKKPLESRLEIEKTVGVPEKRKLRQTTISFSATRPSEATNSTPETKQSAEAKKTGTGEENPETPVADTKSETRTPLAMKRPPPVGILSANKKGGKKINRAITSTPLHKKKVSKVKFVPMSHVELSPIVKTAGKKINK